MSSRASQTPVFSKWKIITSRFVLAEGKTLRKFIVRNGGYIEVVGNNATIRRGIFESVPASGAGLHGIVSTVGIRNLTIENVQFTTGVTTNRAINLQNISGTLNMKDVTVNNAGGTASPILTENNQSLTVNAQNVTINNAGFNAWAANVTGVSSTVNTNYLLRGLNINTALNSGFQFQPSTGNSFLSVTNSTIRNTGFNGLNYSISSFDRAGAHELQVSGSTLTGSAGNDIALNSLALLSNISTSVTNNTIGSIASNLALGTVLNLDLTGNTITNFNRVNNASGVLFVTPTPNVSSTNTITNITSSPVSTNPRVFPVPSSVPNALILDRYPQLMAWDLRRARINYTGPCIRVRNNTSNATTDIGFLPNGNLDTAALATAMTGATTGSVIIWYDQMGTRNLDAAVNNNFPLIWDAGALVTKNSRPALKFLGPGGPDSNFLIANTGSILTNQSVWTITVVESIEAPDLQVTIGSTGDAYTLYYNTNSAFVQNNESGGNKGYAYVANGNTIIRTGLFTGYVSNQNDRLNAFQNGQPISTWTQNASFTNTLTGAATGLRIGVDRSGLNYKTGTIQALYLSVTNNLTSVTDMHSNLNAYYSAY